jgi:hypothetical protein
MQVLVGLGNPTIRGRMDPFDKQILTPCKGWISNGYYGGLEIRSSLLFPEPDEYRPHPWSGFGHV